MARPAKSIAVNRKKLSIDEINKRLEAETRLKGDTDALIPPSYLTENQIEIFEFIRTQLDKSGILGNLDIYVLTQVSIAIDRIQECEKTMNMEGIYDLDGKPHPAIKIKESYVKEFNRYCNELSLSPQSRAKLANINVQAMKEEQDPLLNILGGDI